MQKILIIDQLPISRLIVKDALAGAYQVVEATDAEEALDLALTHQFALILVDMERTDEAGPEICALLKETDQTRYTPLILLSSHEQKDEIINGLHAGAEDYMTKPINPSDLLARIDSHLRTRDYYSDLDKKDLLMVLELSEIISVTRNPKKILQIVVDKMVQAIDVTRCSIIAIDEDGELVVKASSDLSSEQEIKINLANYPEIEKASTSQRPVIIQDVGSNELLEPVKEKIAGITDNAIFVLPIIKKQNVIGTFFLRTATSLSGGITDRVLKLCQVVANISGNALENAVIFESMQTNKKWLEDLALRDSLTKLYNHQHFHTRLAEEFSRAERYSLPLSCVFLDLDDFKHINDRYGHIAGDLVLKQIGRLAKQVMRRSDIAARYGGEEFALILPNTSLEGANELAERLLAMIRSLSIGQIDGQQVTASIGISAYHGKDLINCEEMLQSADQAMYLAKQSGKNRICRATLPSRSPH